MEYKLPVNELRKHAWRFSIMITLTTFVSTYIMEGNYATVAYRSFLAFMHFMPIYLMNLALHRRFQEKRKRIHPRLIFLIGICITSIYLSFTTLLTQYLSSKGFFTVDIGDEKVKSLIDSGMIIFFIPFVSTILYSIVHFFQSFISLVNFSKQKELELMQLQSANIETTNQLLKQQIQPHFLFNALNTLKSLIKKRPETAETYLIQLSDFLRASINVHQADTVTIGEELKLCENYMEMQKIRFGDALHFEVYVPNHYLDRYKVPFFSLQPLLENAIKHNELTKVSPLFIRIVVNNQRILVVNNLKKKKLSEPSTGNGLRNLSERYRILVNDEIIISQNDEEFMVSLKLIPDENTSN